MDTPASADPALGHRLVTVFGEQPLAGDEQSWATLMFLSSALVVEIGGSLSHAAVVARELGVPCVMGLDGATTRLRNGDRCRVDGTTGEVTVITPAARA